MTTVFPTITSPTKENSPKHHDDLLIRQAILVLEQRMFKRGPYLERPQDVRQYLRLQLAGEIQEVFSAVWTCPYKTGHQLPIKLMPPPSA